MRITTTTAFDITHTALSRAVTNFVEDCGYNADSIKLHYLDYVLCTAIPYEDEVLDFIEKRISPEDKKTILFAFATEFEAQFHRDLENALAKEEEEDC